MSAAADILAVWYNRAAFCATTTIRNKSGESVPLIWSPAQHRLEEYISRQEERGLPIRGVVLKPRQVHMSVAVVSQMWLRAAFLPGQKVRVTADVHKNAANLYGYWRQFIDGYRPLDGLRQLAVIRQSAEHLIEFEGGGQVLFDSAERATGGRSHAVRFCHNSESAFWRDAATLRTGLLSSVPYEPGTMIIDESTANGLGGSFYDQWMRATDPSSGSDWFAMFYGWHEHPEYQMPVDDAYRFEKTLTDEEQILRQKYRCSMEQIHWRRRKIATDCDGDPRRFQQEFPSCPEEAFLSSGRPRFDQICINRQPTITDPLAGELELVHVGTQTRVMFVARSDHRGALRIWRKPSEGHRYTIGVDVAEGIDITEGRGTPDPDYSVAQVIDADTGEQVAVLRGRLEPAVFAQYVHDLGRWYEWAWLVPETNSVGLAFMQEILRIGYPVAKIYRRRREPTDLRAPLLQDLGWKTGVVSKPQLISQLDRALRNADIIVRDPLTLQELRTFVYRANGSMEAAEGAHDDCVISLALGVIGIATMPQDRGPMKRFQPVPYQIGRRSSVEDD